MFTPNIITNIIAALGFLLGVVNLYLYLKERTPILRVNPALINRETSD